MTVDVAGRSLRLSNREKVFWPETGFTKGQLVDYYTAVSEAMVPHLSGRPITLRRWPDGVEGASFFQKHAPSRRPAWIDTVDLGGVEYLRIDEPATLVWAANLAAIEIHPGLALAADLGRPTVLVLDLDPGPPADILTCCEVAVMLRTQLASMGLHAWPKTSGSKGLQLYLPLNADISFDTTRLFAQALARLAESEHPDLVVSIVDPTQRKGKVLVDWAQNAPSRTTVSVYSVRALGRPSVSVPVTWDEIGEALERAEASSLRFGPDTALRRIEEMGDLMAPVLAVAQDLPPRRDLEADR